jgi:MFS family permease
MARCPATAKPGIAPILSPSGNLPHPLAALLPLYIVIFAGFVGYSLMITVSTPMLLRSDSPMIAADDPMSKRTILLGFLLCLYPQGQFLGSPVLGSLSDRFDRKPVLLISLAITTLCYSVIAYSLAIGSFALLAGAFWQQCCCNYTRNEALH